MGNIMRGVGINFSNLRPTGANLSMEIFDVITRIVKQEGFRRGALRCFFYEIKSEVV